MLEMINFEYLYQLPGGDQIATLTMMFVSRMLRYIYTYIYIYIYIYI